MGKKFYATAAIAILALFAVPTAAIAAGYVPQGDVVVSGDAVPSGTVSVSFTDGSFTPGESVSFAVTGAGTATLSTIKAGTGTLQKSASSAGAVSVTITLPSAAVGTYTVTATGSQSGTVATATLTVVPVPTTVPTTEPTTEPTDLPQTGGEAGSVTVSGTPTPGSVLVADFNDASFTPGEQVRFDVTGEGTATLSMLKAATASLTKTASATGATSVNVTLPTNATGSYALSATGLTSGIVHAPAAIVVTAATTSTSTPTAAATATGTSTGLASTGYNASPLLIWAALGALVLGIAIVAMLAITRRRRSTQA